MPADNAFEPRPYLMRNRIQHYSWGTRGADAFIPHLLQIPPQDDIPYAELWMGTHPNAPSDVLMDDSALPLSELIARHPVQVLGPVVAEEFSGALPFLFKVLSAGEALSIQVHPDRLQAQALHAQDPEHYVDANHKPEVAVALDSLAALVGFRSYEGILRALEATPELAGFIGGDPCGQLGRGRSSTEAAQRALVEAAYTALVRRSLADEAALVEALSRLEVRLRRAGALSEVESLFLTLRRSYPGPDIGLLTVFLLNLIHLSEGQGVYIPAGVPHAYLSGNIIECMAASDNVVRAGLTDKFKDVEALLDVLTYELGPVPVIEGAPEAAEVVYQTPAREFEVVRLRLQSGASRREPTYARVQILLVTRGDVRLAWDAGEARYRQGESLLIPAAVESYTLHAEDAAEVFFARVPLK